MSAVQPSRIAQPAPTPLSRIEGQYRSALARRWLSLVIRSALLSTFITAFILWLRAGFSLRAALISAPIAAATYPLTVYPILSARRSIITNPAAASLKSSFFSLAFSSLSATQGLRYLAAHLASGLVFTAVYALIVNKFQPTAELGLLAATPRHPFHLNERFIFLLLGNAGIMATRAIYDVLGRRLRADWPTRKVALSTAVWNGVVASFYRSRVLVRMLWLGGYSLLYFALRKRVWLFLLTHTFGILRPFVINFVKPSRSLGTSIIPHLLLLQLLTVLAARLPPILAITPYLTLPLNFEVLRRRSPLTPEQHLTTALKSKNPYYLHFTLMELLRVSNNPARRQALFTTTSKSQPPILSIWEDLLLHLGRAHQTLINRGGARPATSAPKARPPPVKDAHSVQIRQANIFRPTPVPHASGIAGVLQSALEGPVQTAPPAILGKAQVMALDVKGKAEIKAVEWKGEVMGRVEGTDVGGAMLKGAKGFWTRIGDWTGSEWAARYVEGSIPEVIVIERILDLFATLACASLQEDTYGYVQQVLPSTLEVIVRHRSALLSLQSELLMNAGTLARGQERAKRDISARVGLPIAACEKSITRIADAFGDSLAAFRFPPSVASALTGICNDRQESQPN